MSVTKTAPFDVYHERYETWFEQHESTYQSELLAVRALLPWDGLGLEVGVGTGRFAAPLGIQIGIDPSRPMLDHAAKRGIKVVQACAEALPFADTIFNYVLVATTICFVDDVRTMLAEARRVLKCAGCVVIGFIDRASALGQCYVAHQAENVFYRGATFYSPSQIGELLQAAGFEEQIWVQTLPRAANEPNEIESLKAGYGEGAFVVVRATTPRCD